MVYWAFHLLTSADTMLPQYTSQYAQHDSDSRDTPTEPLLKSLNERTSTETAPPTYPPGPSTQQPINVGYRYAPVYPRKGGIKNAVGVLCMTKQVGPTLLPPILVQWLPWSGSYGYD